MKAIKQTLLALALAGAFTNANATPVDWTLEVTDFSAGISQSTSGYTTFGTFTYDSDTNTYSNVALRIVFNNNNPYIFGINSGDASSFAYGTIFGTGIFTLTFDTALSNAGGSIDATLTTTFFGVELFSTKVTSATTAVPEPEVYAMMLAGLGLVGFAARRQLA